MSISFMKTTVTAGINIDRLIVENSTFLDTEEGNWDSLTIGQYPGGYIDKGRDRESLVV